nr:MAG: hypothetical protein [Bacteriophage sp.]
MITPLACIDLPQTRPSIAIAVSNKPGYFLHSFKNSVAGFTLSSSLPYFISVKEAVFPLVTGIIPAKYCAMSLSILIPLAVVRIADLLPSVLNVQMLSTLSYPYLFLVASIILCLFEASVSISTSGISGLLACKCLHQGMLYFKGLICCKFIRYDI